MAYIGNEFKEWGRQRVGADHLIRSQFASKTHRALSRRCQYFFGDAPRDALQSLCLVSAGGPPDGLCRVEMIGQVLRRASWHAFDRDI
jgi:hypothetical protein